MSHDRSTVEAVVQHYFDALYEGDADKLGAIFHPSADLRWLEKGELQVLTVPDWLGRVRKPPPPRTGGQRREANRAAIDRSDATTALFHRLSGGDETWRWLADRFQIVPLRSEGVSCPLTQLMIRLG